MTKLRIINKIPEEIHNFFSYMKVRSGKSLPEIMEHYLNTSEEFKKDIEKYKESIKNDKIQITQ